MWKRRLTLAFLLLFTCSNAAYSMDGEMSLSGIYFTDKKFSETRGNLQLKEKIYLNDSLSLNLGFRIDTLLSERPMKNKEILVKADDTYLSLYLSNVDVKIGYQKVFWGKLDQLSPTDIINPLDISKLFLEKEKRKAKIAIPILIVSSWFGKESRLDLIFIPFFEAGVYDEIDEQGSPFNIIHFPLPVEEELPSKNIKNSEYGVRFSSTFRQIDFSLYYFRGFEDFPSYRLDTNLSKLKAEYPKIKMFGGDFELAKATWGIRGEGAFFINKGFQKKDTADYIKGDSFVGGIGIDRHFGDNYLNLGILYRKAFVAEEIEDRENEVTLMAKIERTFSYERWKIEFSSLYNTMSRSVFFRGIFSINLWENFSVYLSLGVFDGEEENILSGFKDEDILSGLKDSDFFFIKGRYNF